jgi:hypothetical protein
MAMAITRAWPMTTSNCFFSLRPNPHMKHPRLFSLQLAQQLWYSVCDVTMC